jgi:hypothetical protein
MSAAAYGPCSGHEILNRAAYLLLLLTISKFAFKAYARLPINPPSPQLGCDIDISLSNRYNAFEIKKGQPGAQTEYDIDVVGPAQLGLENDSELTLLRACQDFVLGCNLLLGEVALSLSRLDQDKPQVTYAPTEVKVEEVGGSTRVFLNASVGIRAEVSFVIGHKEVLDEKGAVSAILKVKSTNRFNLTPSTSARTTTITNALHEFEGAMNSIDRLLVFKHLYNSLELSVNADGGNEEGTALDSKMFRLINGAGLPGSIARRIDESLIANWRTLYNRTKHVQRREADVMTFVAGIENLPTFIELLRPSSAKILLGLL